MGGQPSAAPMQMQQAASQDRQAQSVAPVTPAGEDITYLPGPEDPPQIKWGGHHFNANVPKRVTNQDMIKMARGNKYFKVGAFKPSDAVPTREEPEAPKTPEQYRAHAIAWLKTMQSVDQLDRKWAAEETLRMSCEVGFDDVEYLMSLMGPVRAELRKRDQQG